MTEIPDPGRDLAIATEEAVGAEPASEGGNEAAPGTPPSGDEASLLALVDQLAALLERSDLVELEVEAGSTGLILRKPGAFATIAAASAVVEQNPPVETARPTATDDKPAEPAASKAHVIVAPLTGIFYTSPSPGSAPYLAVGGEVVVGQVIGLIEAMKLFNEIKSDKAGRVVRYVAEHGGLVKAKQPLVEVEPL